MPVTFGDQSKLKSQRLDLDSEQIFHHLFLLCVRHLRENGLTSDELRIAGIQHLHAGRIDEYIVHSAQKIIPAGAGHRPFHMQHLITRQDLLDDDVHRRAALRRRFLLQLRKVGQRIVQSVNMIDP